MKKILFIIGLLFSVAVNAQRSYTNSLSLGFGKIEYAYWGFYSQQAGLSISTIAWHKNILRLNGVPDSCFKKTIIRLPDIYLQRNLYRSFYTRLSYGFQFEDIVLKDTLRYSEGTQSTQIDQLDHSQMTNNLTLGLGLYWNRRSMVKIYSGVDILGQFSRYKTIVERYDFGCFGGGKTSLHPTHYTWDVQIRPVLYSGLECSLGQRLFANYEAGIDVLKPSILLVNRLSVGYRF
ncbi:MAG: hypothetical protein JNJ58_05335 [Chitinophagaceae bacterium]|nr:hypothetical protein [Chitinophagaceae bacterium]